MDLRSAIHAPLDHSDHRKQAEPVNLQMPATMLILKVLRFNNNVQPDPNRQEEKAIPNVKSVRLVNIKIKEDKVAVRIVIKDTKVLRDTTQNVRHVRLVNPRMPKVKVHANHAHLEPIVLFSATICVMPVLEEPTLT